ncbi:MAG: DUF5686 family protein [Bacteroidota bacterium]
MRTAFTLYRAFLILCAVLVYSSGWSQQRGNLRGRIMNDFTKETVPFASVYWKKAGFGSTSDSAGNFLIRLSHNPVDTLVVSYVGFADVYKQIRNNTKDTANVEMVLRDLKLSSSVEVKSKFSKGLRWWKLVVTHKAKNNPYKYQNYAYELYNKMELDINNVNRKYFTDKKLLRPFTFLLDNIDSISDHTPFLPIYMTEALSDYYYSVEPHKIREEIRAAKTDGMKNESMLQFIGGINQKVNVYENFTNAMGKEFISPLSDVGDKYYNYKGADTQYISGQRYLHLLFTPKRDGENTFSGDCWIHGGNWGIYKINLNISATANINYVNRLSIVQEFGLQPDSAWMFAKDKTVIDFAPFGKEKLSFIARRTSTYKNVRVNDPSIVAKLATNSQKEEVIVAENARDKDKQFWENERHEDLSVNEKKVYKMMDTIKTIPAFIKYTKVLTFVFDGHKKFGAIEIGPWYKWVSGNQLERLRMRFDLGTTEQFSKNLRFHGYIAYGFKDARFKGRFDVTYKVPNDHGITLFTSYTHDLDNGRTRYNDEDITTDNIFSQLIRRPRVPQKFLGVDEIKLAITKEWKNKFSVQPFFTRTAYETFNPLPTARSLFNHASQENITSSELGLKLRYAPGERTFSRHRKEVKLKTSQPIFEARIASGVQGLFKSNYLYTRLGANITQSTRIPRWGKITYMVYGGQIFSQDALPFMLLEIHPGNEIYYYNKQSFNLMNRFEYISDRYAGINIEHNLEKKLLNLIPFMRKSNMRQFWNIKSVWGDLSDANRKLNIQDYYYEYRQRSLRGIIYTEIGTGFENIFKLLRIDLVWRNAPLRNIPPGLPPSLFNSNTNGFGIFGSIRLQF